MIYELYFWREEGEFPLAADSVLTTFAKDPNLSKADRLSQAAINSAFRRRFPDIVTTEQGVESEGFKVSLKFDESHLPVIICVSSANPLHDTPELFARLLAVTRELGCSRIESAIKLPNAQPCATDDKKADIQPT